MVKDTSESSECPIHQDAQFVDETKGFSISVWVPLCDVNKENGALSILPGSHYDAFNVIRSPTLPFFFSGSDSLVLNELVPMEVKAGTAVILNQSVIHYSPPNHSKSVRKAITAGIKSEGSQMYFHYKVPEKEELEVFEMEDDFLISFKDFGNDIRKRPYLGKSIGFIPYKILQLPETELKEVLKKMKNKAGFEMNLTYIEPPQMEKGGMMKESKISTPGTWQKFKSFFKV